MKNLNETIRKDKIERLMSLVEDYFEIYLFKNPDEAEKPEQPKRDVYVSTDGDDGDGDLIRELRDKYPKYVFHHLDEADSFKSFLIDLHYLKLANHLVCQRLSSVCRTAYELRQYRRKDNSKTLRVADFTRYSSNLESHFYESLIRNQLTADKSNLDTIFDTISFGKGASVIRMRCDYIGAESF